MKHGKNKMGIIAKARSWNSGVKKTIAAVLLSSIMLVPVLYIQTSPQYPILNDEERAWIAEHPVIRATNKMEGAPFDFVVAGQPAGFSIDYLNLVAKKVGLKINYVNGYTWEELLALVKERKIDIAHSLRQSSERSEYLDFTKPYVIIRRAYFGRKGTKHINNISDLAGKKIGVYRGFGSVDMYRKSFPQIDLVEFDSALQSLTALSNGEIDVTALNMPNANYVISQNSLQNIEVIGQDLFYFTTAVSSWRLASRNDWPMLNIILEKGMAAITEEELRLIRNRWQINSLEESNLALTLEELNWLSQNKTIRVAADPTRAPIEFIDENNQISGISGAYLSKIAQKLNIEFVWIESQSWFETLENIKTQEAELIAAISQTPERLNSFIFTDSYLDLTNVIYAREDSFPIANIESLAGRRIALVSGSALSAFIRQNYTGLEIIGVKSTPEALNLLSSHEVDAYIGNIPTAAYYIALGGHSNIVVVGETPFKSTVAMGIRKDIPLLASAMQKALQSITQIENAEILSQWLFLPAEKEIDYKLIFQIGGIGFLTIIFVIILIWVFSLRREVTRRLFAEKGLWLANERLKELDNMKSIFIASVSHELRTPLNSIIGFSGMILSGMSGDLNEEQLDGIGRINRSGKHLLELISDIINISKIEAGRFEIVPQEVSLEEVVKQAVGDIQPLIEPKGIKVEYNVASWPALYTDRKHLLQCLHNYLSNAAKYTIKGSITISVDEKDDMVEIAVTDTGIGIAKADFAKLFHPFERLDSDLRMQAGGTGLGLHIVKKIATEILGGDVSVKSELGKGSTFSMQIPKRINEKTIDEVEK